MAMAKYKCIESFGVDGGELDGLTPAECFVLGVEWQKVATLADGQAGFECPIHSANQDRVKAILGKRNREYKLTFMAGDVSESWMWLVVQ